MNWSFNSHYYIIIIPDNNSHEDFRIHTTSVELELYACVLRLLSMKETCWNLVRNVDQRED